MLSLWGESGVRGGAGGWLAVAASGATIAVAAPSASAQTPTNVVPTGSRSVVMLATTRTGTAVVSSNGARGATRTLRSFCTKGSCEKPEALVSLSGRPALIANRGKDRVVYRVTATGVSKRPALTTRAALRVVDGYLFGTAVDGGRTTLTRYDARFAPVTSVVYDGVTPSVAAVRSDGSAFVEVTSSGGFASGSTLEALSEAGVRTPLMSWPNGVLRERAFRLEGDRLYFFGADEQHGTEPWVTDGTPAGTRLLADLVPGAGSVAAATSGPVLDGYWYITALVGREPRAVHRIPLNGPVTRTLLTNGEQIGVAGGRLLVLGSGSARSYRADDPSPIGPQSTALTAEMPLTGPMSEPANSITYWVAGTRRGSLWRTDGTPGGTARLVTLPIPASGRERAPDVTFYVQSGKFVYFDGGAPGGTRGLWRTDGTRSGTVIVSRPGESPVAP